MWPPSPPPPPSSLVTSTEDLIGKGFSNWERQSIMGELVALSGALPGLNGAANLSWNEAPLPPPWAAGPPRVKKDDPSPRQD